MWEGWGGGGGGREGEGEGWRRGRAAGVHPKETCLTRFHSCGVLKCLRPAIGIELSCFSPAPVFLSRRFCCSQPSLPLDLAIFPLCGNPPPPPPPPHRPSTLLPCHLFSSPSTFPHSGLPSSLPTLLPRCFSPSPSSPWWWLSGVASACRKRQTRVRFLLAPSLSLSSSSSLLLLLLLLLLLKKCSSSGYPARRPAL